MYFKYFRIEAMFSHLSLNFEDGSTHNDFLRIYPLSVEFSIQGYRSGLPFRSPGYLPDLKIEPESPALQEESL